MDNISEELGEREIRNIWFYEGSRKGFF